MIRFLSCLRTCLLMGVCVCLLLAGCDGRVKLGDDFAAARQAQAERNWPLAERLLQRFLRTEQDAEKRWQAWQALIEVINAETREARETLEFLEVMRLEFAEDEEKTRSILEQTGEMNERRGRLDRAMEAWTAYLDLGGLETLEMAKGYRHLASVQIRLRRFESAEETLGQCMSLPGSEPQVLYCMYDLADLQAGRQNWQAAADLCQQLLESNPDRELQGLASYVWGDALEQLGQLPGAMKQFETARESYPNPSVIENRIMSLRKKMKK